MAVNSEQL